MATVVIGCVNTEISFKDLSSTTQLSFCRAITQNLCKLKPRNFKFTTAQLILRFPLFLLLFRSTERHRPNPAISRRRAHRWRPWRRNRRRHRTNSHTNNPYPHRTSPITSFSSSCPSRWCRASSPTTANRCKCRTSSRATTRVFTA